MDIVNILNLANIAHIHASIPFVFLVIVISVFLFGEIAILSSFIIFTHTSHNIFIIGIASLFGTIASDMFWFVIGRYIPFIRRTKIFLPIHYTYQKQQKFFLRNPGLILFFVKYFYGFRWSTIIYYASSSITLSKYILLDTAGSFVYILFLGMIGIILGEKAQQFSQSYHHATNTIMLIVLVSICLYALKKIGAHVYKNILIK